MQACGFSSTSYNPAQTTAVTSISVSAVRPTATNQLTTTFSGADPTGFQSFQSGNAAPAIGAPAWSVGAPLIAAYAIGMFFVGALAV